MASISPAVVVVWLLCAVGAFVIARDRGLPEPPAYGLIGLVFGPFGVAWALIKTPPAPGAVAVEPVQRVVTAEEARLPLPIRLAAVAVVILAAITTVLLAAVALHLIR